MLKDKLQEDQKTALKERDSIGRSVLGMLLTAVQNKELAKRAQIVKEGTNLEKSKEKSQLTDDEILAVVTSEVKKRKDSKEQFEKGNRPELAQKEQKEIEFLSKYLPAQLSKEEITKVIKKVKEEMGASGPQDMGRVMGGSMKELKGKADGNTVQTIVKELLN